MNRLVGGLLFSVFFLSAPCVFAQNADQTSSGSGVLISPANHGSSSDQDSTWSMDSNNASNASDQDNTENSGHHHHHNDGGGGDDQPSS